MSITVAANHPDIEALKRGDEKEWRRFFHQFDRDICAIAAWPKWHFDAHTREDVVQIIRMAVVQSISQLQSEQALQAFVRKICVHRCIDMLRRKLREQGRLLPLGYSGEDDDWQELDVAAGDEFDPVTALQRAESIIAVRAVLTRMDAVCRELIKQFYVDNRSYRDIAQSDKISINTVGSRLSRCLSKFKGLFEDMKEKI